MKANGFSFSLSVSLIVAYVILSDSATAFAQGSRFAIRFFGTGTGQVDRVKIPISTNMPMNVGHDFTIEFWMRASYVNNTGVVYPGMNGDGWITGNTIFDRDIWGPGDYGDFGIAIGRIGTNNVLAFGVHNGSWGNTIVGTNNVGDFRWHHIAAVRVASNGLMRLYVDGILDASGIGPTGNVSYRVGRSTSYPNSDPFIVVGAEKHDAGSEYPSFFGTLDELRIWNRALTTAELAAVRGAITPPSQFTNLVGYWRFEEGTNQIVRDSALGYTGTLYSGVFGNGEWRGYNDNTNFVAPIALYEPLLDASVSLTGNVLGVSWFGQQNVRYALTWKDNLLDSGPWSFVANATNLTAAESNITVSVNMDVTQRFYRVLGNTYR